MHRELRRWVGLGSVLSGLVVLVGGCSSEPRPEQEREAITAEGPDQPTPIPVPEGPTNRPSEETNRPDPEPEPKPKPPPDEPWTAELPSIEGWSFFGPEQGGPKQMLGVSADEGGNIWVAGGEDGLFLLRPGAKRFERFGLEQGLHPFGYLPDGSDVPGPHYLNVLSVSGGPAGTVFVGYGGKPTEPGDPTTCENNWDYAGGAYRDARIYKSGDADRVTLTDTGITVVHYDIFSGPQMVAHEREGRERVCDIHRIKYIPQSNLVWFGGNHGFAFGDPAFPGIHATGCVGESYGDNLHKRCTGNTEHAHPMVSGYNEQGALVALTDGYRGIDADPSGAMWIGGAVRSLHYDFGPRGEHFWTYEENQFNPGFMFDVWADDKPSEARPEERKEDLVSALAAVGDGTAWFASFTYGLAHVERDGTIRRYYRDELVHPSVHAVHVDPEGSVWAGGWGGLTRLHRGQVLHYTGANFGFELLTGPISDISSYVAASPLKRRLLVTFKGEDGKAGALGIYSGD